MSAQPVDQLTLMASDRGYAHIMTAPDYLYHSTLCGRYIYYRTQEVKIGERRICIICLRRYVQRGFSTEPRRPRPRRVEPFLLPPVHFSWPSGSPSAVGIVRLLTATFGEPPTAERLAAAKTDDEARGLPTKRPLDWI
jgi:hypothetical protein